jgi:hypothetical protein
MKIDDIGEVIEEVDRLGVRSCSDQGRIVSIVKNNEQYLCQACGSCEITVQTTCVVCNVCQSRTAKENDSINDSFQITIISDNKNEYSLKISRHTMMPVAEIYDQLSTKNVDLADQQEKIAIDSSLRVQFQYDQSTGIIQRIGPIDDTSRSSSEGKCDHLNLANKIVKAVRSVFRQ